MQPISIIGSASSQIGPADSARVVVFLEQTPSETGGKSWLEIFQMTLFYLPDSSSFPLSSSGGSPVLARSCLRFLLT